MTNALFDAKLARRLQKRGGWKYTDCLRRVQQWLTEHDGELKAAEIRKLIDAGGLDLPAQAGPQ